MKLKLITSIMTISSFAPISTLVVCNSGKSNINHKNSLDSKGIYTKNIENSKKHNGQKDIDSIKKIFSNIIIKTPNSIKPVAEGTPLESNSLTKIGKVEKNGKPFIFS